MKLLNFILNSIRINKIFAVRRLRLKVQVVKTNPFEGQKPGTSGLRKKTKVFQQENYLENFIQAIFNVISMESEVRDRALIVGGDGRYFNDEAIQLIVSMALANGFKKILVGREGIFSTPAVSAAIRKRQALGGIILSASHNPAGIDEDFGIKLNLSNGGPSPTAITEKIFKETQEIKEYRILTIPLLNLSRIKSYSFDDATVEIIDPISDYVSLMEELFDFNLIRRYLSGGGKILFDGMNAVTGPYAEEILVRRLGATAANLMRCTPLKDFGGIHPDPNLVYAKELVARTQGDEALDFAAASDGDGDRNMILGNDFFVSPGDSLAIIVDYLSDVVPAYREGLLGVARSMPTSRAVDRVAKEKGIPCYETPTGWKYFGNLMDARLCSVCGEESFGTGSSHIREKDGLWAILAWLSILAKENLTVSEIVNRHWKKYGRDYFQRYDFEALPLKSAREMMKDLKEKIKNIENIKISSLEVKLADSFSYQDPVDQSVSENQGYRIFFKTGERLVFRLSGTGTEGATLRIYIEAFSKTELNLTAHQRLGSLAASAIKFIGLKTYCNRDQPNVIT